MKQTEHKTENADEIIRSEHRKPKPSGCSQQHQGKDLPVHEGQAQPDCQESQGAAKVAEASRG